MHDPAPRHPETSPNPTNAPSRASGLGLGPCLVLADASVWSQLDQLLAQLPTPTTTAARLSDPYAALLELLRRPMAFRAVIVSLQKIFPPEIAFIKTLRDRLTHIDIVLAHTDGRSAALAEAVRLGATALLDADGLHRLAHPQHHPAPSSIAIDIDPPITPIAPRGPSTPKESNPSITESQPSLADVFASISTHHTPGQVATPKPNIDPKPAPDQASSFHPPTDHANHPSLGHQYEHLQHQHHEPTQEHSQDPIDETHDGEPILTADELRALLQDSESR